MRTETAMNANETKSRMRKRRGRRLATGLNTLVSMGLATALAILVNQLVHRAPPLRVLLPTARHSALSEKTLQQLRTLDRDVEIVSFFDPNHELYRNVRSVLREYQYESLRGSGAGRINLQFVDPYRDLPRTRALKQIYDLSTTNTVVFAADGKTAYVSAAEIAQRPATRSADREPPLLFFGEQAFTSALQNILHEETPVVYFLTGHGERHIADFSEQTGYGSLARILRRDNMAVEPLDLARHDGIPEEAAALIVAGPSRALARMEVDKLRRWLQGGGRLAVMLDPWTQTGLEELLLDWGVLLGSDSVHDREGTFTGRELIFQPAPDHPITRPLRNLHCIFYGARSVEPKPGHNARTDEVPADKARAKSLGATSPHGWAQRDRNQRPPVYNAGIDQPGPVSVAVAVAKGPPHGEHASLPRTRLVVFGDSFFLSNPALAAGAAGNVDLFMNALNWLLERETLISIAPGISQQIELNLGRRRRRIAFLSTVGALPMLAFLVGALVWWKRRR